jgi:hypothetical protein
MSIAALKCMSLSQLIASLPPLHWIVARRRESKLKKVRRRLLEWNHDESLPKLQVASGGKTTPFTTC